MLTAVLLSPKSCHLFQSVAMAVQPYVVCKLLLMSTKKLVYLAALLVNDKRRSVGNPLYRVLHVINLGDCIVQLRKLFSQFYEVWKHVVTMRTPRRAIVDENSIIWVSLQKLAQLRVSPETGNIWKYLNWGKTFPQRLLTREMYLGKFFLRFFKFCS